MDRPYLSPQDRAAIGRIVRLRQLTIRGFRTYREEIQLEWEPGAYYLLGKREDPSFPSNGAGKTSLIGAIAWCLFGCIHTGASKDSLINWDSEEAYVELVFDSGLMVRRNKTRKKSEVLSYYWKHEWHEGDLTPTQEGLEALLGISKTLFFNGVWLSHESKTVKFLFAPPAQRLEILEEIVADELYSKARTVAERTRKDLEQQVRQAQVRHDEMKREEEGARARLLRAQQGYQEAAEADRQRAQRIANRKAEIADAIRSIESEQDAYNAAPPIDEILAEVQKVESEFNRANQEYGTAEHQARHLRGERGRLLGIGPTPTCPTCLRPYAAEDVAPMRLQLAEAEAALQVAKERLADLTERQAAARTRMHQANAAKDAKANREKRIGDLENELKRLDQETGNAALANFQATIRDAQQAIRGIQGNMQQYVQLIHEAGAKIPDYKFWETGFSSKGIRSLLMDDIRTLLQHHVSYYCRELAGRNLRIEFPPTDKGFEIIIHTPRGPLPIESFSTGEVWRANLAVLLGLRKVLQYSQTTQLDMLFLDDANASLDAGGDAALVELAQKLADEFGLVFVTLPRRLDNIPPGQIVIIERVGDESRITTEV